GKARFLDVVDGTSNTIMLGEDAGRQQIYAKGIAITPNAPCQISWTASGPTDKAKPGTLCGWTLNGSYSDVNNKITIRGFSNNGMVRDGGCCVVNCSNVEQLYGFHTGGVNTVRGDASVQFLGEGVSAGVVAALVTRAGGEVFNDQ